MGSPFPVVKAATHLDDLCKLINKITPAVLVEMPAGGYHIVTRYDIISAMS
jgi:cystathionine beta-synthase